MCLSLVSLIFQFLHSLQVRPTENIRTFSYPWKFFSNICNMSHIVRIHQSLKKLEFCVRLKLQRGKLSYNRIIVKIVLKKMTK